MDGHPHPRSTRHQKACAWSERAQHLQNSNMRTHLARGGAGPLVGLQQPQPHVRQLRVLPPARRVQAPAWRALHWAPSRLAGRRQSALPRRTRGRGRRDEGIQGGSCWCGCVRPILLLHLLVRLGGGRGSRGGLAAGASNNGGAGGRRRWSGDFLYRWHRS